MNLKKSLLLICCAAAITSCNNSDSDQNSDNPDSTAVAVSPNLEKAKELAQKVISLDVYIDGPSNRIEDDDLSLEVINVDEENDDDDLESIATHNDTLRHVTTYNTQSDVESLEHIARRCLSSVRRPGPARAVVGSAQRVAPRAGGPRALLGAGLRDVRPGDLQDLSPEACGPVRPR